MHIALCITWLPISERVLEKKSYGTTKTTPGYDQLPIEPQTDKRRKVDEWILLQVTQTDTDADNESTLLFGVIMWERIYCTAYRNQGIAAHVLGRTFQEAGLTPWSLLCTEGKSIRKSFLTYKHAIKVEFSEDRKNFRLGRKYQSGLQNMFCSYWWSIKILNFLQIIGIWVH